MDYKGMWFILKAHIELGVEEGIDRGFDKSIGENGGIFHAYKYILNKMKQLEEV